MFGAAELSLLCRGGGIMVTTRFFVDCEELGGMAATLAFESTAEWKIDDFGNRVFVDWVGISLWLLIVQWWRIDDFC